MKPGRSRSEDEYLDFNPFDEGKGDYAIECRTVRIVTTRKPHPCMASYLVTDERRKGHFIEPGARAYKESAKVEGQFGTAYSCLPCLDSIMLERD